MLRCILNVAVDDEKIPIKPYRIKSAGGETAPERPVAIPEQVLAIADAIEPQYRALVILNAWCSLRFGELAGLRRSRVDLLHRKIHVVEQLVELAGGKTTFKSPKSDSGWAVDIPSEVGPILEDHPADYVGAEPDALLFTSPEGHPLQRTKFRPRWGDACRKAWVAGLHFHDLRSSGATWAAVAGATLPQLMHRLGHRTHTVALRYQHAAGERHRQVADRLGALLRLEWSEADAGAEVVPITPVTSHKATRRQRARSSRQRPATRPGVLPVQSTCRRAGLRETRLADSASGPATISPPKAGRVRIL